MPIFLVFFGMTRSGNLRGLDVVTMAEVGRETSTCKSGTRLEGWTPVELDAEIAGAPPCPGPISSLPIRFDIDFSRSRSADEDAPLL
jgi:hypothetical protein